MKTFPNQINRRCTFLALVLVASVSPFMQGAAPEKEEAARIDPKIRREVEESERRLCEAIEKKDAETLSKLLANYFATSFGKSKKAMSKAGALSLTRAGELSPYKIEKDWRLSRSVDTYTVEGKTKKKPDPKVEEPQETEGQWLNVRRIWTKQEGQWLLVAQMITKAEADQKKDKAENVEAPK